MQHVNMDYWALIFENKFLRYRLLAALSILFYLLYNLHDLRYIFVLGITASRRRRQRFYYLNGLLSRYHFRIQCTAMVSTFIIFIFVWDLILSYMHAFYYFLSLPSYIQYFTLLELHIMAYRHASYFIIISFMILMLAYAL